jgi:hypothetical protein
MADVNVPVGIRQRGGDEKAAWGHGESVVSIARLFRGGGILGEPAELCDTAQ